jgi:hypothetical protein
MLDADIRKAMHKKLLLRHHSNPDSLVVDELDVLYGMSRIDVAVIGSKFIGYEIKSDGDTFRRLPWQIEAYGRVFDKVTLVTTEKHVAKAKLELPPWWGITVATGNGACTGFRSLRRPKLNYDRDVCAIAAMLWKPELIGLLREDPRGSGANFGMCKEKLVCECGKLFVADEMRDMVSAVLRHRPDWRMEDHDA